MRSHKIFIGLLFFLIPLYTLYPQAKHNFNFRLSHPVSTYNNRTPLKLNPYTQNQTDTFYVQAIMIDFQEDSDPLSTGNGKFDYSNKYFNPSINRDTVIDAPPYDSTYFIDHLEFMKNYYYKSSKGKLIIKYNLLNRVITLPKQMKDYSPQKNENYFKLGELFKDSWARADSFINFSNINQQKTSFFIFHAGVGKDVDLTSLFGYDPAPYDIPSVFLGIKNLKEIYGSNYNGYTTNEGFIINNSAIIPSTELRELSLISGITLLELGINGILTASFGSFLGLPDLFDTQTGKTAIGRFGLMDGQSIFSFNGIFPPEPSAWEKVYLGWVNPVLVTGGELSLKINTSSKTNYQDSTIFKVLINSKEYFLIENRNRNPFNDGQKVYAKNKGNIDSTIYAQDIEGFINYDISRIDGNVIDVRYFDWSLPGLICDTSNYSGGILIWHIDENIIDAKISTNQINTNIEHRGVDLEEAKGSQDIGVTINTPFGQVTGDGTYVDYWFNGNHYVPSTIYKNEFTPTSYPNSLSYSLTNNNIFITNFDSISSVMSFKIRIGSEAIKPLNGYPKFVNIDTGLYANPVAFKFTLQNSEDIFINTNGKTYGFNKDGNSISANPSGLLLENHGKYSPSVIFNQSNLEPYIVSLNDSSIVFLSRTLNQNIIKFPANNIPSCSPLVIDTSNSIVTGFNTGLVNQLYYSNLTFRKIDSTGFAINQFTSHKDTTYTYIYGQTSYAVSGNINGSTSTDTLILIDNKIFINGKQVNIYYTVKNISNLILGDVNQDGKQEIIFISEGKLYCINNNGVVLDNFPFSYNQNVSSGISIADVNNDNVFDLVFAGQNGDMYAYGIDGNIVNGFPVKVGPNTKSTPSFVNINDTLAIAVFSGDGYLYAYKTNTVYNENKILWKNYLKDKYFSNNNFLIFNNPLSYSEKLPQNKIYNWPNPVYDSRTYIRYFLNGNASSVEIKILDLSGELITKIKGSSYSNSENEVVWDVSSVQSGIYYGIIEANIDGTTESKIIKIAVVK